MILMSENELRPTELKAEVLCQSQPGDYQEMKEDCQDVVTVDVHTKVLFIRPLGHYGSLVAA